MPFDYLAAFPIPAEVLPKRLKELLSPVGMEPRQQVEVACMQEHDPYGDEREAVHMQMAVALGIEEARVPILNETGNGVVAHGVPAGYERGCSDDFSPSLSGHDYIVASWGSGYYYSFALAEKVWMTLGLSPRCVGNNEQHLVYDDLSLPEFGVADGQVSSKYHYTLKRAVTWRMSNEYLRRYLWLRGARGVRTFYYQKRLPESPQLRGLMNGKGHALLKPS